MDVVGEEFEAVSTPSEKKASLQQVAITLKVALITIQDRLLVIPKNEGKETKQNQISEKSGEVPARCGRMNSLALDC